MSKTHSRLTPRTARIVTKALAALTLLGLYAGSALAESGGYYGP